MVQILQNILWLGVIAAIAVLARKIKIGAHSLIVKELIGGIVIGGLVLINIPFFEPMKQSGFLSILSEIAISFFLFRIGFSATIGEMRQIGMRAFLVAIVGVVATFILGLLFAPYIVKGLTDGQYIFIALALTTTSVGITAGILKELGQLQTLGAKIVLAAAVMDDIISLLILAIIMNQTQSPLSGISAIDLGILKILVFIGAGVVVGQIAARTLPALLYRLYPYVSAKIAGTLLFFVVFFVGSKLVGFSPIVGAFIGGLVLERGYFDKPSEKIFHGERIEAFLETTSSFIIPIFFVVTGLHLNLAALFSLSTILIALGLLIVATLGKLACGLVAGRGNNPWLVGIGMVPRGEVGLVFANLGLAAGMFSPALFSAFIIVVMGTTLFTPAFFHFAKIGRIREAGLV